MQKQETLSYEEQFKNESVNFSPFAIWNTGIAPSQTILTVDTYSLACVPYQFSMQRGVLLGALSQEEIVFFQRFKGALAGLGLSYKRPEEKKGSKVFCRCQIDRENIWVQLPFRCAAGYRKKHIFLYNKCPEKRQFRSFIVRYGACFNPDQYSEYYPESFRGKPGTFRKTASFGWR